MHTAEETVNHDQGYYQHLGLDTQFKSHLTSFLRDPVIRMIPEKEFNLYQKELNVTTIIQRFITSTVHEFFILVSSIPR